MEWHIVCNYSHFRNCFYFILRITDGNTKNPSLLSPLVKTNLNQGSNRVGFCPPISDLKLDVEKTSKTTLFLLEDTGMMHEVQNSNSEGM
jgi:hypothetical protein